MAGSAVASSNRLSILSAPAFAVKLVMTCMIMSLTAFNSGQPARPDTRCLRMRVEITRDREHRVHERLAVYPAALFPNAHFIDASHEPAHLGFQVSSGKIVGGRGPVGKPCRSDRAARVFDGTRNACLALHAVAVAQILRFVGQLVLAIDVKWPVRLELVEPGPVPVREADALKPVGGPERGFEVALV